MLESLGRRGRKMLICCFGEILYVGYWILDIGYWMLDGIYQVGISRRQVYSRGFVVLVYLSFEVCILCFVLLAFWFEVLGWMRVGGYFKRERGS